MNDSVPFHSLSVTQTLERLKSSEHGLSQQQAAKRLQQYGHNRLPAGKKSGLLKIFLQQFKNPLIYVLLAAAVLSLSIAQWHDAAFIFAVLLINAVIGTIQEFSAQHSADALQQMVTTMCRVLRQGEELEIDALSLVPGDIILLESGERIPADLRLLSSHNLEVSEAALTGESLPVRKNASVQLEPNTPLAERSNMLFAGTLLDRGRATAVVVATGIHTELGSIASVVTTERLPQAPLLIRMQRFTHLITLIVAAAAVLMAIAALLQGMTPQQVFLLAVALAVSAIPEGLPVALTIALSIGMRRMAKRNVIVRQLVAVESLGSCTFIATDKTGTLTINQLTARQITLPSGQHWAVHGEGMSPEGEIESDNGALLDRICVAAVLPNEGFFGRSGEQWVSHGDAVDVAFLVMAHKAGFIRAELLNLYPEQAVIPFESEQLFSASLNRVDGVTTAFAKGAVEKILSMCSQMATQLGDVPLDANRIEAVAGEMAQQGYRVLALASGEVSLQPQEVFSREHLNGLVLLALVGLIDPLREQSRPAIAACRSAGIEVAMVTGDHPLTAFAIARELGLEHDASNVVTGLALKQAASQADFDRQVGQGHVFARVEPTQKLEIVRALQRQGHFVAVTGDGANDAPALQAAEVGVAMGKSGTDVARETAKLIITDDNFSSIVSGIEQGRVAYANVRKVIFLLISTGAAEIVLISLALLSGLPLPLLPVQLLWLNLVTNGIQHIALTFEPAEGDELSRPPRKPTEAIFNRLMIERVLVSALVIGLVSFLLFQSLLGQGYGVDEARNATLLLMVLFENIHAFNSRSESLSVFRHNPFRNGLLLAGAIAAQLIHIGAMYTPWLAQVLQIHPVSLAQWLQLLTLAFSVMLAMELHKLYWTWYRSGSHRSAR